MLTVVTPRRKIDRNLGTSGNIKHLITRCIDWIIAVDGVVCRGAPVKHAFSDCLGLCAIHGSMGRRVLCSWAYKLINAKDEKEREQYGSQIKWWHWYHSCYVFGFFLSLLLGCSLVSTLRLHLILFWTSNKHLRRFVVIKRYQWSNKSLHSIFNSILWSILDRKSAAQRPDDCVLWMTTTMLQSHAI